MLNRGDVEAEEERLRNLANSLPDERRKAFYREASRQLKDPDTYAVLNWLFITGLHHFYLRRWGRGALDLGLFLVGIWLIVNQAFVLGGALILSVFVIECWALFRAQVIVQDWNNQVYRRLLERYSHRSI